jgi:Tfp pilus assembly protein PilZ
VPGAAHSPMAKKAAPRVALFDLDEATESVLRECFRQFGIQTVILAGDSLPRLRKEKFEACVLRLDSLAGEVLETIRNSPSNNRMVIYGLASSVRQALTYSKYGINAVFDQPLERQQVLKVVRSTYLLVLHELRRYVRIPLITQVHVHSGSRSLQALTQEISAGGMSVEGAPTLRLGDSVQLSFDLPDHDTKHVNGTVCWIREEKSLVGLRFDPKDERRLAVRDWIETYLEV